MSLKNVAFGAAAAAFLTAGGASATTVTYESTEFSSPVFQISVDDDTAGRLTFGVSLTVGPGDILGVGLNSSSGELALGDLVFLGSNTGEGITGVYNDTKSCGDGCNFNGGGRPTFDTIVRFGESGVGTSGELTSLSFGVLTSQTLAEFSLDAFGIRAQETSNQEGSVKLTEFDEIEIPPAVPLPAAIWGLGAALLSFGALGRRRRRQA